MCCREVLLTRTKSFNGDVCVGWVGCYAAHKAVMVTLELTWCSQLKL